MLGDLVLLHRAEGAKTYMQRHIADTHAHGLYLFQQLLGEMEARRGCGGAAHHLGVHGLIALTVLQLLLDIGWQRHFAQAIQRLQKDALVFEAHQAVAAGQFLRDLGSQLTVTEGELCALAHQALPGLVAPVDQQQHLAGAAARHTLAQQTGRQHTGIVEDQTVARMEILRQIEKVPVLPRAGGLIQHQQAGGITPLDGRLGDQLLGQVEIKVMCFHILAHF